MLIERKLFAAQVLDKVVGFAGKVQTNPDTFKILATKPTFFLPMVANRRRTHSVIWMQQLSSSDKQYINHYFYLEEHF